MNIPEIIPEFKANLQKLYGDNLQSIILYGSWARGEANENSDIDLMVVLTNKITPGKEIDRMLDLITDLNLKYGELLSVCPVSAGDYEIAETPFLNNIHREGVLI